MTEHPRDDWNRKDLLTEVIHRVDQVLPYRSSGDGRRDDYANRFSAISSDLEHRPLAITPRPLIYGPQTATVVAASGEEIHLDKLGWVCIQFFWDRLSPANAVDNSCDRKPTYIDAAAITTSSCPSSPANIYHQHIFRLQEL
ncbi:hypothetical protein [Granulicella arctica]|uniref:Uncharacterized protein involved in type VI secretion and phage assembly n=1 Tax=Granulicella arctica TaxID=940613 RepID=A0A7Y9TLV6_9BACT|nr:hypothetical protein [Granulicella arctica]NYF80502.1 uncharacterized protein involved in type VI secretion and phage assembly [Granulicella arctica]